MNIDSIEKNDIANYSFLTRAITKQGYCLIDNFLSSENYQQLMTECTAAEIHGAFNKAKIGNNSTARVNQSIRRDAIAWLNEDTAGNQAFFAAIELVRKALNQDLYLGLVEFESHYALYQPGDFYKKHIDQFKNEKTRRISCVYYLNHHWQPGDGGELTLYSEENIEIVTLPPLGNRLICFCSELPHEVHITHKKRYSIAGWLRTRPYR
ncbi:MAG: 2OG-Fe(II) oxygenase [Legionella sp.]